MAKYQEIAKMIKIKKDKKCKNEAFKKIKKITFDSRKKQH